MAHSVRQVIYNAKTAGHDLKERLLDLDIGDLFLWGGLAIVVIILWSVSSSKRDQDESNIDY